jgi:hypothetical protein
LQSADTAIAKSDFGLRGVFGKEYFHLLRKS